MKISYFSAVRKSVKIEITSKGEVRVFYPEKLDFLRVEEFVKSKEKWIKNKVFQATINLDKNQDIFDLKAILLLGKRVKIDFCEVKKPFLSENILFLPIEAKNDEALKKKYLKQFVTKFANEILPQATSFFAEKIGKCPSKISVSHQKSIWGSCNSKKEIRFNAKAVMLPKQLMEYVVIHELCHMKEMNHSKKFWQEVNCFCNANECRKLLKEYNFLINLF